MNIIEYISPKSDVAQTWQKTKAKEERTQSQAEINLKRVLTLFTSETMTTYEYMAKFHNTAALSAHRILLSPGTGCGLVLGSVRLVHVGNLRHQRIVRIGVGEQGAYREQDLFQRGT